MSDGYSLFGKRPLAIAAMNAELLLIKNGEHNSESAPTLDLHITPSNIGGLFHFSVKFLLEMHGFEGTWLRAWVQGTYMVLKVEGTWFREYEEHSSEGTVYRVWGTQFRGYRVQGMRNIVPRVPCTGYVHQ